MPVGQQEEELLDAVVFTGSVIRCTIEPIGDRFALDTGFNQVKLEIGRPDDQGSQLRLSITTNMRTDGLTLSQIQGYALEHASKLVEHTRREIAKVESA